MRTFALGKKGAPWPSWVNPTLAIGLRWTEAAAEGLGWWTTPHPEVTEMRNGLWGDTRATCYPPAEK